MALQDFFKNIFNRDPNGGIWKDGVLVYEYGIPISTKGTIADTFGSFQKSGLPNIINNFDYLPETAKSWVNKIATNSTTTFQVVNDIFVFSTYGYGQAVGIGTGGVLGSTNYPSAELFQFKFSPDYSDPVRSAVQFSKFFGFTPLQQLNIAKEAKGKSKEQLKGFFSWIGRNWKLILSGALVVSSFFEANKTTGTDTTGTTAGGFGYDPTNPNQQNGTLPNTPVQAGGVSTQITEFVSQNLLTIGVLAAGTVYLLSDNSNKKRKR